MFDTTNILTPIPGRFVCGCMTPSEKDAEMIVARFLMSVRMANGAASLYRKGCVVFVDTPSYNLTVDLAQRLNNSI